MFAWQNVLTDKKVLNQEDTHLKKKTLIIIIVAAVLIAALVIGLVWYFVWNDSAYIGRDAAEAAALADAGFAENEVQRLRSEFERDDGLVYYDVSFVQGATEYEYVIDPNTAAVLHMQTESVYD